MLKCTWVFPYLCEVHAFIYRCSHSWFSISVKARGLSFNSQKKVSGIYTVFFPEAILLGLCEKFSASIFGCNSLRYKLNSVFLQMAAHHFYKIKNLYKMAFLVNNPTQRKTCLLSFFIQVKLAQNTETVFRILKNVGLWEEKRKNEKPVKRIECSLLIFHLK